MDAGKLKSIIATQNNRRERDASNEAENIIEQIVGKQSHIARLQLDIANLRETLIALEVEQLDPNTILGG